MRRIRYPWKTALVLWAGGSLLSPLLLFYAQKMIAVAPHPNPIPAEGVVLVLLVILRSAVMLGVGVGLGLPAARALGMGAPWVDAWIAGRRPPGFLTEAVRPAVLWAVVTALIAMAVDAFFYRILGVTTPAPEIHARLIGVEPWRGFAAAVGGGLFEELFYRLFLMSVVAWILVRVFRAREGGRQTAMLWTANLIVAVYFGYDHFGNEQMWEPLTTLVALRTVLIILPPGLAFGYLFWKRGIETAALSHVVIVALVHGVRPWIERGWGG